MPAVVNFFSRISVACFLNIVIWVGCVFRVIVSFVLLECVLACVDCRGRGLFRLFVDVFWFFSVRYTSCVSVVSINIGGTCFGSVRIINRLGSGRKCVLE